MMLSIQTMVKYYLIIACFIFFTQNVKGQFLPEFSQQIKMPEFFNPGYNGFNIEPSAKLLYSNNYRNTEGYNGLFAVDYNSPINKWNAGFGVTMINELVGEISKSNGTINSSVAKKISKSSYLTFGIGLGFEHVENNDIKNTFESASIAKSVSANYFYSSTGLNLFSKKLHLGIGMHNTQLAKKRYFKKEDFTYFFNGSYNFVMSESPSIKPLFLYRYHLGHSHYELGFLMNFSKIFETGLSYRSSQSLIYFADITLFKWAVIGYSFQHNFDGSTYLYEGLHEFSLTLNIPHRYIEP